MTENSYFLKKSFTLKFAKTWDSCACWKSCEVVVFLIITGLISAAAVGLQNISDPLSSEAVGFAAAAFEFQNIPDPLSSEAVVFATVIFRGPSSNLKMKNRNIFKTAPF